MPRDSWNREVQRCLGLAGPLPMLHASGGYIYISTSRETLVWFCDPTDQPAGAHRNLFRSLRSGPRHAMLQLWSTAVLGLVNTTTYMSAVEQDRQRSNTTVASVLNSQVASGVPREPKFSCHSRVLVGDWLCGRAAPDFAHKLADGNK